MQVLTDGLSLPVVLFGDFDGPSDFDGGSVTDYYDPQDPDRVMFAAPLLIGAQGDLNTDLVLAADPGADNRQSTSLENAASVTSVGVRELLGARGDDSLAYVTAGMCVAPCCDECLALCLPHAICPHRRQRPGVAHFMSMPVEEFASVCLLV